MHLTSSGNINATYNWWGTTDSQAINQSIYDNKNDFNLGVVNYTPFLTAPNPKAMLDPNAPIPTPNKSQTTAVTQPTDSSSQNPTATPQQPNMRVVTVFGLDWEKLVIIVMGFVIALLVAVIALTWRRTGPPKIN